jgi:hypothetical protein
MSDPNNRRRTRTAAFETPAAADSGRRQRRRVVTTAPRTRTNRQSSQHRNESSHPTTSSRRQSSRTRTTSSRRHNQRTVTPATSIRDTARNPTRGSGRYGNETYGVNYFQGRRVLFSPGQQQQQEQQQEHEQQQPPVERVCYCDQPVDRDCQDCAANRFCTRHPGFIAVVHVAVGSMPLALDMNSILDLVVPWKEPFCRVLFCRKEMNRSRFVCQLQILRKVLKTRFSVSSAGNRANVSWLILQWTKTLILSVGRSECCDWVSFHPVLLLGRKGTISPSALNFCKSISRKTCFIPYNRIDPVLILRTGQWIPRCVSALPMCFSLEADSHSFTVSC